MKRVILNVCFTLDPLETAKFRVKIVFYNYDKKFYLIFKCKCKCKCFIIFILLVL